MVENFPGQPPHSTTAQPFPTNRTPASAQVTGSGGTLVVNSDGSLNVDATTTVSTASPFTEISISAAMSGDNTLVAGTNSKTIKVYRLVLVADAATDVIIKNGSTALTGTMSFAINEQLVLPLSGPGYPWFVTTGTNSLVVNLGGISPSVGGFMSYIQS